MGLPLSAERNFDENLPVGYIPKATSTMLPLRRKPPIIASNSLNSLRPFVHLRAEFPS